MQQQQHPRMVLYQQPHNSGAVKHFNSCIGRTLGIIQIITGVLCVIFNVVGIVLGAEMSFVGHGIWGGAFFVVTGSIGLGAATSKSRCMITSYMVLSIIAVSAFVLPIIICSAVGLRNDVIYHQRTRCADYRPNPYPTYNPYRHFGSYSTYNPFYRKHGLSPTQNPNSPYGTYMFTTYSPYQPYTRYRQYRPYGSYTTYTSRPFYRQHGLYPTYKPYHPYGSYTTNRPYYRQNRPYRTYKPYRPYGSYTTNRPYYRQNRPYRTYKPYRPYGSYTKYRPYQPYTTNRPYRQYGPYPTHRPGYGFGSARNPYRSYSRGRRYFTLCARRENFIYNRMTLQEKQAMHGLLICMALIQALMGILAAIQGCNKICGQPNHLQLVAVPQELTNSIFWPPQTTNMAQRVAVPQLTRQAGAAAGMPNRNTNLGNGFVQEEPTRADTPPPAYSSTQTV